MKTVLAVAALLLTNSAGAANVLGYMPNDDGGRIELYAVSAPKEGGEICKDRMVAKAWGPKAADAYGCWTMVADTVVVRWFSRFGAVDRTYFVRDFTINRRAK